MGAFQGEHEKELSMVGYPVTARNNIVNGLSMYIRNELSPEFTSNGYQYKWKKTFPLEKKKKVPRKYWALEGFEHTFKKGLTIGTKVEVTYDENKIDHPTIKVHEESWLRLMLTLGCAVFFAVLAYLVTVIFYEYWILVFVSLFVCFCITFVLIVLPAIVGLLIGYFTGWVASLVVTPPSSKQANERDGEYLATYVFRKAENMVQFKDSYSGNYSTPPGPPPDREPPQAVVERHRRRRGDKGSGRQGRTRERRRPPQRASFDDDFWDDDEF